MKQQYREEWDRKPGEDLLDYIHRLAKRKWTPHGISIRSGIPRESIVHVFRTNGYWFDRE